MGYVDDFIKLLRKHDVLEDVIVSVLIIVAVLAMRAVILYSIRRTTWRSERMELRLIVQVKRVSWLVVLVALFVLWAPELKTMALGLAAIAVAFVIAIKELLLCAMGGMVRASSGSYTVGDRIDLGGVRGDVIDLGVFTTTVLEIGSSHQWTGRAVTLPNSLLLTGSVINETFTEAFVLHIITVPLGAEADWRRAEQVLLEAGEQACAEFLGKARRYMSAQAKEHGHEAPTVEPHVTIQLPDPERLNLMLRLPTPARDKGEIEQQVLRRFLKEFGSDRASAPG